MKITRSTALTAAALSTVAVSACSASVVARQAEPKLTLRDSAAWLTDAQVVTADVSLAGSAADWSTLIAKADAKALASSTVPDALLAAHVLISIDRGADGKPGTGDDTTSLSVRAGGKALLDVFTDTTNVYLKADAAAITALVAKPQDAPSLAELGAVADSALPGAGALVRGQWVSVKVADVAKTVEQYGASGGKSDLSGDPAQLAGKVRAALSTALQDVSVANDPTDPSHLVVTSDARAMATALAEVVPGGVPVKAVDLSEVPSSVKVDAFVADGNLRELRLGLNQFSSTQAGPVGLRVLLSSTPAVTRPTDATALDLGMVETPGAPLAKPVLP